MRGPWRACIGIALSLAAGCSSGATEPAAALGLRIITDISLPGDTSRFDYVSLDAVRHRLYVSHLGANEVIVVDTDTLAVERTLRDVASVHGVLAVPSANRVFAAATGSDQAVTYDATTLHEVARSPTGRAPDGLAYDPDTNGVFVSNEADTTVTEIDATTGRRRGDIDIASEAGNVAYDPTSRRILVDAQSRNDLAVIDPASRKVIERHRLPGCDHDHGLLVDTGRHRAFVACDGNAKLLELDLTTFAVARTFNTGDDPDVLTIDPDAHRLFVLAESGVATIVDTSTAPATEHALGQFAPHAHSGTTDPSTHRLYVPVADVEGHPVLRVVDDRT